jgi:1-acyl-sn-glycerol-3-phosphate acyltransferase
MSAGGSALRRLALQLRAVLFWLGWIPSTVLIACLLLLTFPLPILWRYRVAQTWTLFNVWWLRLTCGVGYRVIGAENIRKVAKAAVIMSKHQSTWETMALQRLFPPQVWVLKRELMWIPFFGWGLALVAPIAIQRGAGRRAMDQLLRQGADRLARGLWVVIFPEGTRVPPGKTRPYKLGGAVLAAQTGYPIVPVAHNAGRYWPRHSFIKHPGTVTVVIGEPIEPAGRTPEELNVEVKAWIEARMAELDAQPPPAAV